MSRTIKIDYVTDQSQATFTCPFCEQEQTMYFQGRIVRGRLSPDPMNLVRQHLYRASPCPGYRGSADTDRDIEEDYRIVVHIDGLKITQTGRL